MLFCINSESFGVESGNSDGRKIRVSNLISWGHSIVVQDDEVTTTFENIHIGNRRKQLLHEQASNIDQGIIPETWLSTPIVHLAPIYHEISVDMIDVFNQNNFICMTPQGWLRQLDKENHVTFRYPKWFMNTYLNKASCVVMSNEDVKCDLRIIDEMASIANILAVTEGQDGATIYYKGNARRFPAPEVLLVDSVGAGDIFAAAFFIHYFVNNDPWKAARFSNVIAAHSVSQRMLDSIPTKYENTEIRNFIEEKN